MPALRIKPVIQPLRIYTSKSHRLDRESWPRHSILHLTVALRLHFREADVHSYRSRYSAYCAPPMQIVRIKATIFSIVLAASLQCGPSSAGIVGDLADMLEVAGKASLRLAKNEAVSASARRTAGQAFTLVINDDGMLQLTKWASGAAATTLVLRNGEDIARHAQDLIGKFFVTPEVLTDHPDQLKMLLSSGQNEIEIASTDISERATLELQPHLDGGSGLVVRKSDKLTFSPAAWEKRGLLEQPFMPDLLKRLRVITLVARTDVVQRSAFRNAFGTLVDFADDDASFAAALKKAKQRLVVVVSHVEESSLVVRGADGSVLMKQEISSAHQAIDGLDAIALFMGCNVACNVGASGPTTIIDAFDVIQGLRDGAQVATPMEFLTALAERVGSFHVDTDVLGRLRAVSGAAPNLSDRIASGASTTRVLFPSGLTAPVTFTDLALTILGLPLFLITFGWIALLFIGMGPRTAWRTIKDTYAVAAKRDEGNINKLSRLEIFLLITFGPTFLFLHLAVTLLKFVVYLCIFPLTLLIRPLLRWTNPTASARLNAMDLGGYQFVFGPKYYSASAASLLIVCITAALALCVYAIPLWSRFATDNLVGSMGTVFLSSISTGLFLIWRFPNLLFRIFFILVTFPAIGAKAFGIIWGINVIYSFSIMKMKEKFFGTVSPTHPSL
jgi:hypothetical protein